MKVKPIRSLGPLFHNKTPSNGGVDHDIDKIILMNLPCYVYWKNSKSQYLGANSSFLELAELPNQESLVGKTDFDLPWASVAQEIIKDDQHVLNLNGQNDNIFSSVNVLEKLGLFNSSKVILNITRKCFTYRAQQIIVAIALK